MIKKVLHNNKAFTLIEVLVSFAIFGLIIVPLSGFFLRSVENNQAAREQLEAGQLAQEVLEELKHASSVPEPPVYEWEEGAYKIKVNVNEVNHIIDESPRTPLEQLDISGENPVTIPSATPTEINYVYNGFSLPSAQDQISIHGEALSFKGDMFPALAPNDTLILEMWDASGSQKMVRLTVKHGETNISGNYYTYTPIPDGDSSSVTLLLEKNSDLPLILKADNHATGNVDLNFIVVRGTRSDGTNYSDGISSLRGEGSGMVNISNGLLASPRDVNGRLFKIKVSVVRAADEGPLVELESYKKMP